MIRLPEFRYAAPRTASEAASILAGEGPDAMLLAGGTDLLPNMKRRQQVPKVLVGLRGIPELRKLENGAGLVLGAGLSLSTLVHDRRIPAGWRALWEATAQIATPHLRNMGTLGGNLCLDTRCSYYDQSYEWRKAISFCMKKDGEICWVAPGSPRCLAISSTDAAPALIALGAEVTLLSPSGRRTIPLEDLYANDGIHYLVRAADEVLTEVRLGPPGAWRSTYWKLRRRGSFDFPVLGVAAAARAASDGTLEDVRMALGAVASRPLRAGAAEEFLRGKLPTDDVIAEAAVLAAGPAKPMDNTDFTLHWRKRVTRSFVGFALRELRGEDMREVRARTARRDWGQAGPA